MYKHTKFVAPCYFTDNVRSEIDDPNNDTSSFSENAWDNYQVMCTLFGRNIKCPHKTAWVFLYSILTHLAHRVNGKKT